MRYEEDKEPDTFTLEEVSKIEETKEPVHQKSGKTDDGETENDSDTQFYDMCGKDGTFGMISHKVANIYRQLHSPVMTQAMMMLLLAVAVANQEFVAIADVKGAFLYALLLPEEVAQ